MRKMKTFNLHQKAENWVSIFVLMGCCFITFALVFAAYKANALGGRLSDPEARLDSEAL